jgi:hypothetical protein
VAFRNSFVTSVGHVPLLLLAAVVVVASGHGSPFSQCAAVRFACVVLLWMCGALKSLVRS